MTRFHDLTKELKQKPRRWLVTGVAGFIGSHLLESLLKLDQEVIGLDNLSTGSLKNLDQVRSLVGKDREKHFSFYQGDIGDQGLCEKVCSGVDVVLHQAALGSVPRSIKDPRLTHQANVEGFFTLLLTAKNVGIKRFVYASSSSVYGDSPDLPKVEDRIGAPLSPYAATKQIDEVYARAFGRAFGMGCVGLRYFNVFGPRQDPAGEYAAVIPRWIRTLREGNTCTIFGDGLSSRDFCYVENVVQANILAACASEEALNREYNIALGGEITLNELHENLARLICGDGRKIEAHYEAFRAGDVRHSRANIELAKRLLGYEPSVSFAEGLRLTVGSFAI